MAEQEQSQKTEEPTQRRIEEAVKKGQVAQSRELISFLILFTLFIILLWLAPSISNQMIETFLPLIESPHQFTVNERTIPVLATRYSYEFFSLLAVPMALLVLVVILAHLLQNPFHIAYDAITPKLDKISPLAGFKRIFSLKSFMEFVKGILKLVIIGTVSVVVLYPSVGEMLEFPSADKASILSFLLEMAVKLLVGVCAIMFVIAILDYLYQKFEYLKSLKMTRQEVKDEMKQQEGDPHIKQKLRQIRMERARKRMMAAVPKADVIITNPTHYSIALRYDSKRDNAPVVIAKGIDEVALRIRQIAKKHDVPLVQNRLLARTLYDTVKVDEEIPMKLYQAVADIISYVYKLQGKVVDQR